MLAHYTKASQNVFNDIFSAFGMENHLHILCIQCEQRTRRVFLQEINNCFTSLTALPIKLEG